MPLTAVAIRNAKPRDKQYKLGDERGLYLAITPNGRKHWRFKYRFEGKERKLSFGSFPDVGLADARSRRDEARQLVASGVDPSTRRKQIVAESRRSREQETFDVVADEWLERLVLMQRAEATLTKMRWIVDFARPSLGPKVMSQITAPEVLEVLRKIEARGRYETANRARGTGSASARWIGASKPSVCARAFTTAALRRRS